MTKQEAVEILKSHNKWRRSGEAMPTNPTVLGIAIDTITEAMGATQQLSTHWTTRCECGESSRGETWCCNDCGKPTERHSVEVTDDEIEAMAEKSRNEIHANNCLCLNETEDHIFDVGYHEGFKAGLQHRQPDSSGWVSVKDRLPESLETVWISNGKGWTTLGCHVREHDVYCWAETNGIIYEENGKIVSECECDDLDVQFWQPLPTPPTT